MRKFLVIMLITLLAVGIAYAGGPTLPYYGEIAGMKAGRQASDPHRTFRLVHISQDDNRDKTTPQNSLSAGYVVIWKTDLFDDGVSVMCSATTGDARVAGILATAPVSTDTSAALTEERTASDDVGKLAGWAWLQTYGPSVVDVTVTDVEWSQRTAPTEGDAVCVGPLSGDCLTFYASTASAANGILGFAMDAIAESAAGQIFVRTE